MMHNQAVKSSQDFWNREVEYAQTMQNVTRLTAIENERADTRFNFRKSLDSSYKHQAEAKKKSDDAQKVPSITGPVSIEALGSSYGFQLKKQEENDLK